MKKTLLSLALLAFAQSASAQWIFLYQTADGSILTYADQSAVRKSGRVSAIPVLTSYKDVQEAEPYRFASHVSVSEFDCATNQESVLEMTLFSGQMGRGEKYPIDLEPSEPTPVIAGTMSANLFKLACAR